MYSLILGFCMYVCMYVYDWEYKTGMSTGIFGKNCADLILVNQY